MADATPEFDPAWYLQAYPDVAASGMDPLTHFQRFGKAEGRGISAQYPTLASITAPRGTADPNAKTGQFDAGAYLKANPDVASFLDKNGNGVDPLTHYLGFGYNEGRAMNANTPSQQVAQGGTPMLNPSDPNSWAAWAMKAHAQTDGLNSMPRMAPDTARNLGRTPADVEAQYYPKGMTAGEIKRQADAAAAMGTQAAAPAAPADGGAQAAAPAVGGTDAALMQLLFQQQAVKNLGMGNVLAGGYNGQPFTASN